jgi:hypothetical protein
MKGYGLRLAGGILLIAAGLILLLDRFGVVPNVLPYIWIALFAASGVVFVIVYATDRRHWWALIPGFTLLGLSVVSGSAVFLSDFVGELGGAIFLGGIALAFWLIFILHREHWWAGIPAGVLTTLAVVAGIGTAMQGLAVGVIFFIGLGLTFLLLYVVPPPSGRMVWPLIPAGILLVMGILMGTPYVEALNYVGPVALILGGGYFLYRSLRGPSAAGDE